jgi:ParB family chromosome partitioning protein
MKNAARISVERIVADPQHRETFDEDSLEQLAASITDHGQLQPVRVRFDESRGVYVVIAGERRLRAIKLAGLDEVDCIIADGELSEAEILTQQIIENCQREDLLPVERARAFHDLMEREGWDGKQLAAELHVSEATVSNALKLLGLDEDTQAKVDSGEVKASVAISSLRKTRASTKKAKKKPPRPRTYRTKAGRVVVEPKVNRTHLEALELALEAERKQEEQQRRAA